MSSTCGFSILIFIKLHLMGKKLGGIKSETAKELKIAGLVCMLQVLWFFIIFLIVTFNEIFIFILSSDPFGFKMFIDAYILCSIFLASIYNFTVFIDALVIIFAFKSYRNVLLKFLKSKFVDKKKNKKNYVRRTKITSTFGMYPKEAF